MTCTCCIDGDVRAGACLEPYAHTLGCCFPNSKTLAVIAGVAVAELRDQIGWAVTVHTMSTHQHRILGQEVMAEIASGTSS